MKYVIIGSVAAGAGAAARLRRLDEQAQIILLDRSAYMSYANCGLPYHIGGVIAARNGLLVMPPEKFKGWFNIDIRLESTVTAIDRAAKTVAIAPRDGAVYTESYDKLLIATGSSPIVPNLPGCEDRRIHTLWTLPDMDGILKQLTPETTRAVVVGGGFIGLEVAENLAHRGIKVDLIEAAPSILPTLDTEMVKPLVAELNQQGITIHCNTPVAGFTPQGDALGVQTATGQTFEADAVVLCIGVRPNSQLAKEAGLSIGERGHILVNDALQTDDPDIYAAGDVILVKEPILGGSTAIALAGPANKQGRIAANNMAAATPADRYRGTWGAAIVKIGALTAASVGFSESQLRRLGVDYIKLYAHPQSGASYYPGHQKMDAKLIIDKSGKILGAQIVGGKGVDKRIDTLALAMQAGLSAPDLADVECAYAPPYNSAKDPINFLGFIAENVLSGFSHVVTPDTLPEDAFLLDTRMPDEVAAGSVPTATNIPLPQLRNRLAELPKDKHIVAFCQVGLRGYLAERLLRQYGYTVSNLSGGYATWCQYQ